MHFFLAGCSIRAACGITDTWGSARRDARAIVAMASDLIAITETLGLEVCVGINSGYVRWPAQGGGEADRLGGDEGCGLSLNVLSVSKCAVLIQYAGLWWRRWTACPPASMTS